MWPIDQLYIELGPNGICFFFLVFLTVIKCYHPRNKVLQNCSAVFGSVSLVREKLKELIDFFYSQNPNLRHHDREHQVNHQRRSSEREMNGGTGAKRAISVHALDQSAEIDGKFLQVAPSAAAAISSTTD